MNDVIDTTTLLDAKLDSEALADEARLDEIGGALRTALAEGRATAVREFLERHESADQAAIVDHVDTADALAALRTLPLRDRAEVFGYLSSDCQIDVAEAMGRHDLAALMNAMSHDERVDFYKRLAPLAQEAVMPGLARAEREDLRKLSSYPEDRVGAVMTSDYAVLSPEMTVPEAIEALRRQAIDAETVYQAYIVDEARRLLGVVSLRDLMIAPPRARVRDVMDCDPLFVGANAKREEAANLIARYDLMALPVINGDDRLVGIVTQEDAMDVQEERATEDFQRIGTVQPIGTSVKRAQIPTLYKARIVWLVLLVFGNVLSGAGIALFEDTIAAYVALVFFLPLLIGSGGNAGSQAATLTVRALATGDVRLRDCGRLLGRELIVAVLLGLTMAVAVSFIGAYRGGVELAIVVAVSMVVIVVIGSVVGMTLPFVLSRFGRDPATASAPLVTSIADVAGVLIYFAVATAVLDTPA